MALRPLCAPVSALLVAFAPALAAHSGQEASGAREARVSDGKAQERPWTLFVYGAADNNADGPILHFLDSVRKALDDDPGMELVLFLDRSEGYSDDATLLGEDFHGARIYRLGRDSAERLAGGEEFPEITLEGDVELDSGDPETLRKFLAFGKARFPAERTGLMIYSHADGRDMCPDDDSGRSMGIPELTDVIGEEHAVDFLALELCSMGGLEIAYQWRPGNGRFHADVLVAIPNVGPPLDWDRAFARIRSPGHAPDRSIASEGPALDPASMSAEDFGRLVVEEGEIGRRGHPRAIYESAAAYDLGRAEDVKLALDELALELYRAGAKEILEELRGPGEDKAGGDVVMNYSMGRFGEAAFVDLYDLCRRAAGCEQLAAPARSAAERVMEEVDGFILASFGMHGYRGFENGKNGVFVVFPDGDAEKDGAYGKTRVWGSCGWYTPRFLGGTGAGYGAWAFCAEGAVEGNGEVENWFELLDAWFDEGAEGGGLNGYPW